MSRMLAAALLALAACGSAAPTPASTAAPSQSQLWRAWPTGVTRCGTPALYRIDDGQPQRLGDCADLLLTPPASVVVHVGQEIDLHMTSDAPEGPSPAVPLYPLPLSPDDALLRLVARDDSGATGRYLAIATGDLVLFTTGLCLDTGSDHQSNGACPVLRVRITP
jgi:hypothetical protein